jgi:hypothetical protein
MHQIKSEKHFSRSMIIVVLILSLISCGYDPVFYVKGKCITTRSKDWFNTVWIKIKDPSIYYSIKRDYSHDGSNKLCLDNIPDGYFVIRYKDTFENNAIKLIEGQTITIRYSGGDRAGIDVKCLMRNDSLIVQK